MYSAPWFVVLIYIYIIYVYTTLAIRHLPKGLDTFAIDIIIWLLRWNILVEVEFYLIDTRSFNSSDDCKEEVNLENNGSEQMETVRSEKGFFTQQALVRDQALLECLKPYLDGNTSMSEIVYQLATQIDSGCRRLSFEEGISKDYNAIDGTVTRDEDGVYSSSSIPMFSVNADDILALVARSNNRIIVHTRLVGL